MMFDDDEPIECSVTVSFRMDKEGKVIGTGKISPRNCYISAVQVDRIWNTLFVEDVWRNFERDNTDTDGWDDANSKGN